MSGQHYLTSEQYHEFLRLINGNKGVEDVYVNTNIAGTSCNSVINFQNWVADSGANQHMTASGSNLYDTINVSKLNVRVGHHNGSSANILKCFISKLTWHSRLGHPADQALTVLRTQLNPDSYALSPREVCHWPKQTRKLFPISQRLTNNIGELIHVDVWDP